MEHTAYVPLSELLTADLWPVDLLAPPDLGFLHEIAYVDGAILADTDDGVVHADLSLRVMAETAFELVAGVALVVGNGDVVASLDVDPDGWRVRLATDVIKVRLPPAFFRPVIDDVNGEPKADPDPQHAVDLGIPFAVAVNHEGEVDIEWPSEGASLLDLPRCMLGDSGVIIEAQDVGLRLSSEQTLPPGAYEAGLDEEWRGLYFAEAAVRLPSGLADAVPDDLRLTDCYIGTGGFTGTASVDWTPAFGGSLFGIDFELSHFSLSLIQNAIVASSIRGVITLPFFDTPLEVTAGLDARGGFTLAVAGAEGAGLVTLDKPGICSLTLDGLGFEVEGGVFAVKLAGRLKPLLGAPELDWPTVTVKELAIDSQGNVRVDGGWLDLDRGYMLNLYGFQLEITKLGFGRSDDGARWVGFSGAIKLVDALPAGASVEGLRITWYDDDKRAPTLTFNGVGVEFEIPDVLKFKGEVAMRELPGNVRRFDGAIELDLICLSMSVSAQLVIGTAPGYTFFAIYVDAELPAGIPLFATGLGLYGFAGLFALNMEPNKEDHEQWYSVDHEKSWYHRKRVGATDLKSKWTNRGGSVALGAGVTLGTLSDNGYAFSGRLLLAIVFPGPILLIEGAANLLKERAKLSTEDEPTLRTLAVLDGRAGSFTFGVDARYRYGKDEELLDIRASSEVYFSLADPAAWHLYIGRQTPTEQRIRAEIFRLFHANAYLELGGRRLATGAWIGISETWTFGPASVTVEAWIEGGAELSLKPTHLAAYLWLHGKVEARAFGIGIGLSVDARLAAEVFTPFVIKGEFEVTIDLPIFPDISLRVLVQWGPIPSDPPIPLPLKEIAVEHFKASTTWPLSSDGEDPLLAPRYDTDSDEGFLAVDFQDQDKLNERARTQELAPPPEHAPVIPLDGRPHITFGRAVNDDVRIGTTAQSAIDPGWEKIGDPSKGQGTAQVRYSIVKVELHRHTSEDWKPVGQTPGSADERLWGSWATVPALPDGIGDAPPAQTKLWLWSKNPFDYTRRTGGALEDWATARFPHLPCPPPPIEQQICIDFEDLPLGRYFGDTDPAELTVAPFPYVSIDAMSPPVPFTQALSSPGLEALVDLYYRRVLGPTPVRCRALSVRVIEGDGQQRAERTCSTFFDRTVGTQVGIERGVWFYRLESERPGQLLPADIILWKFNLEIRVPALDCTGTLVLALLNPAHRVDFTLWTPNAESPRVDARTQLGGDWVVTITDDPDDPRIKTVSVTGRALHEVSVSTSPSSSALAQVCCDRDYALHLVADDGGTMVGPFPLVGDRATATGKDLRRVRINSVAPYRALQVCATLYEPDRLAQYEEDVQHLREELAHWSQEDFALEPYTNYRLAVTTGIEVKRQSGSSRSFTTRQFAYFRTEGPPGLADLSLPSGAAASEELTLRNKEGNFIDIRGRPVARAVLASALNNLTPYVRQTLPATVPPAGEKPLLPRPVFRAYDLGIEFNENSYVEAMYRRWQRDLALYVFDASNQPARDTSGAVITDADYWTVAEALRLIESERRWIEAIDRSTCLTLDRTTILRDVVARSSAGARVLAPDALNEARLVPLLLHDAFSAGTTGWTVRDEGTEGGPSAWAGGSSGTPPAPFLTQTSSIRGGSTDPLDPVKPGTVLVRADDPRLGAGHPDQPGGWGDVRVSVFLRVQANGWTGVVLRDRGPADAVRFALGPAHWTLVRVAAGTHTLLTSGQHALPVGEDHLVAVEAIGGSLRVYLDGAPLAAVDIAATGGRVGLYCWNAPDARFIDLRVHDFRPDAPVLYRFSFITSRYANFEHQAHSFQDAVRQRAGAPGALPDAVALPGRSVPSPAEVRAFEALEPTSPTVSELEATRIESPAGPVGFLLRCPEPLDWSRLDLQALRAPPWPRPSSPPGAIKLIGATFAAATSNEETVTLLLREASNLDGVVVEQLDWKTIAVEGWRFVDEGDRDIPSAWSTTGRGELVQTSPISGSDELGTCALAGEPDWTDTRLTLRLQSGAVGVIGAVIRYRDAGDCYRFVLAADGSRRLVRWLAGAATVLWEDTATYVPGQTYSLVLTAEGQALTAELDGKPLFSVTDAAHESGRLGPYCSGNSAAHFGAPVVARPTWTEYHTFAAEPRPLPAGTRVRLHAGAASDPHDADPMVVSRFLGTGARLPSAGTVLRVAGHCRHFRPDKAYAPVDLRIVRNADGTGCFLCRPGGVVLDAGEWRLRWTYHRDNRSADRESALLSQAGETVPERPVLDLPWRTLPSSATAGMLPSGFADRRRFASARLTGTEILILKRDVGPLVLHIETAENPPPADVWVLAPSGVELWHGERIDLQLAGGAVERTIDTSETGVFRAFFGARELFLRRGLTSNLPEAVLLKPGVPYLWGSSRGVFLNPRDESAALTFTSGLGQARVVDAERIYHDLSNTPIGVTVMKTRELELQAAEGAAARFVASATMLFGSRADVEMVSGLVPQHIGFGAEVIADAPLAYYRFGDPIGARTLLDASGNGHHGTVLSSGIALRDAGVGAGPAARFIAAVQPRIKVADQAELSPTNLTIEALVAWDGPTGNIQQRILQKSLNRAGEVASYGLSVLARGQFRVELTTHDGTHSITTAAALSPNEPAHLAATYDGSALTLYVNGVLDTQIHATGDLLPTTGITDLAIGNQLELGHDRAFDGVIDELALYDHPLSAERIRAHVDAVNAQLGNLLRNSGFARARPVAPPPLTGSGVGGLAAAEDWTIWNNPLATTTTELLPTTRPDGTGRMLHLTTTGGHCGLVQTWAREDEGPATATAMAWVYVLSGRVGLGSGNGGSTGVDVLSTATGRWELLEAPSGGSPVNELIIYAGPEGGADFYVDYVAVQ